LFAVQTGFRELNHAMRVSASRRQSLTGLVRMTFCYSGY